MFTSSKYQQSDFDGFALDSSYDFIKINQVQNISDNADEFATLLRKSTYLILALYVHDPLILFLFVPNR